jgi:hypothetical protein
MKKAAILTLCLFICSMTLYLSSKAQSSIRGCRRITACAATPTETNSTTGLTQCSVKYSYEGCDGTIPGGAEACVNQGCGCMIVTVAVLEVRQIIAATLSPGITVKMF